MQQTVLPQALINAIIGSYRMFTGNELIFSNLYSTNIRTDIKKNGRTEYRQFREYYFAGKDTLILFIY